MKTLLSLLTLAIPLMAEPTTPETKDPLKTGPGLSIDLISENSSISPNTPFNVALDIHPFPGFHTYWKNPGMVGLAPTIKWTLPEGFTASSIQWPYPENALMAKYPCHGYKRPVTLITSLSPPKNITKKNIAITGEAMWMCCATGCFPGNKTFTLNLPVTTKPTLNPLTKAKFDRTRKELPLTKHHLSATLLSKPNAPEIKIKITSGQKLTPDTTWYFFSSDKQISSDKKQIFTPQPDNSILLSVPRNEFSPQNKTDLPGVLRIGKKHYHLTAKPTN